MMKRRDLRKLFFTLTLLTLPLSGLFGQNEKNFWIFGSAESSVTGSKPNVLNFENLIGGYPSTDFINTTQTSNSGNPIPPIDNTSQLGVEGCAVATHPVNGDLMFYTDGDDVYDDQHNLIASNFGGHNSGSQSTAICYNPADCNYLIFSNATGQGSAGVLQYCTYTYPLGSAGFTPQANMPGPTTTSEGMLIIPSSVDPGVFYLIVHLIGNNTFRVFTIDDTGQFLYQDFDMGPNFDAATVTNFAYNSPTGKFAFLDQTVYSGGNVPDDVYLADFDASTGTFDINSCVSINTIDYSDPKPVHLYDLEFSPDGNVLYYSANRYIFSDDPAHSWYLGTSELEVGLYHHDLYGGNGATLINTFSFTGQQTNARVFGLKLGPDNRIYTITEAIHLSGGGANTKTTIGVIDDPNETDFTQINWNPDLFQNDDVMGYKFPEFVVTPNFEFETIVTEIVDECDTAYAVIDIDTATLVSNAPINPDNVFWLVDGDTLRDDQNDPVTGFPIVVTEPGDYQMIIMVGNCPFYANNITSIAFNGCCYVADIAEDEDYLLFDDPNANYVIDQTTVWDNKIIILEDVIITVTGQGTILDVTTADVVFGECSGINFENGAILRATNSVWRPCEIDGTWRGLRFENPGEDFTFDHLIMENTFKSAMIALDFNGTDATINENLFSNCNIGIDATNELFERPISGNRFIIDDFYPEFEDCANGLPANPEWIGINMNGVDGTPSINQNEFTNARISIDMDDVETIGIDISACTNATISENVLTDMTHAIDISKGIFCDILNNEIEMTRYDGNGNDELTGIMITETRSTSLISGNILSSEIQESDMSNNLVGINIERSRLQFVQNNNISGFYIGIHDFAGRNDRFNNVISMNTIDNSRSTGIFMEANPNNKGTSSVVACNTITNDLEEGNIGITVQNMGKSGIIHSNCVNDNEIGVYLVGAENKTLPIVRNNFVYNYFNAGILNQNYTGSIGNATTPGQNTLWSNNNQATDIASNASIQVYNNFGMFNISWPQVGIVQNNPYHSTASCAQQIYNMPSQGNLDLSLKCDYYHDAPLTRANIQVFNPSFALGLAISSASVSSLSELSASELEIKIDQMTEIDMNEKHYIKAIMFNEKGEYAQALSHINQVQPSEFIEELEIALDKIEISLNQNQSANAATVSTLTQIMESNKYFRNKAAGILNKLHLIEGYAVNLGAINAPDYAHIKTKRIDNSDFIIYPNPARDIVTIDLIDSRAENATLQIIGLDGKVVMDLGKVNAISQMEINVANLSQGVYIVTINTDQNEFRSKLIKE